jgi:hypothetical protein
MTDAAKPKTQLPGQTNMNSDAPAPGPAAAEPCGCGERVTMLEGRFAAYETMSRAMSYLMLAAAAAVIYILWTGGSTGGDKK